MMVALARIGAIVQRHIYIMLRSKARILEAFFWPTVAMVLWGFISRHFASQGATTLSQALGMILGAVLLWDFMFRAQVGLCMAYMEEVWARNMGHLFISPLRIHEWWMGMMTFSLMRALMGSVPAALMAIPFYGFSIFDLGLPLLFFFFNITLMGWWIGLLVTALLIRTGPGAEGAAWIMTVALAPFCGVYYPLDILPVWMQHVGSALPASHVFVGLRALVSDHVFLAREMWIAFALNGFYLIVAAALLRLSFDNARQQGTLLQAGE